MAHLLRPAASAAPHEPVLADGVRERDRGTLNARVNRWIGAFRELGLRTGDTVAIVAGNRVETVEALLACLHTGLTVVPVNVRLTAAEIGYLLDDSRARLVISDPERAAVVARAPGPRHLVAGAGTSWAGPGADVEALLVRASPDDPADQVCGALMPYTSGTTGRPKGVHNGLFPLGGPWRKVERLLSYAGVALGVPADGTVLLTGPWHHSAQLFFSLLPLLRGARLVMTERFDATATLALIDRERVTETHLVPTQFVRLLRLPGAVRDAFSGASLRLVWHGAAPCPAGVKRRMIEWWGPRLTEYYAATEGGVVTQIDSEQWLRRPGSVGRAVPPNEVLVVDDAGRPVPPGVVGRVFVRRRADRDFRYHNAPAKTEAAHLEPGVFTYGERGHLDEHGYLYLAGRSDDMILSGGVNVYPAEVEEVLLSHPRVRDAAVLGLPDDEWGERVVAVVEMAPDAGDPTAELDRHCRRSLAGFKVPRSYRLVSEIPREPTGKLARSGLRSHFREERG